MILGARLKRLRQEISLSQEAVGAQGFVSTPGWIKIENGQRQPSEKLIGKLVAWLVADKHIQARAAKPLTEELLTRKYLGSGSAFVRDLAKAHAKTMPGGSVLLAELAAPRSKPRRGRPALASHARG